MSEMYDPLSEVYMVQKLDESRKRMRTSPQELATRAGRRWWRKASHRTG
jgi:hypothetical protein